MFASLDVLQVAAVTLHTSEAQSRGDGHPFGHRERLRDSDDSRSTETDVDVAQDRQRRVVGEGGRFEFVDAVGVVDHDDEIAACAERRRTLGHVSTDERRGEQY